MKSVIFDIILFSVRIIIIHLKSFNIDNLNNINSYLKFDSKVLSKNMFINSFINAICEIFCKNKIRLSGIFKHNLIKVVENDLNEARSCFFDFKYRLEDFPAIILSNIISLLIYLNLF